MTIEIPGTRTRKSPKMWLWLLLGLTIVAGSLSTMMATGELLSARSLSVAIGPIVVLIGYKRKWAI